MNPSTATHVNFEFDGEVYSVTIEATRNAADVVKLPDPDNRYVVLTNEGETFPPQEVVADEVSGPLGGQTFVATLIV